MIRAAIYARLPIEGNHNLKPCIERIKEEKGTLVSVFTDYSQDGFDFDRPEFKRMELCTKDGIIDLVVVPSLMQFCRDISKALEKVRELKKHGVSIIFCDFSCDDISEEEQEAFNCLLDEAISKHSTTYGKDDKEEDEIHSCLEHMEGYIDDYQIVDESFFSEEADTDD